MTPPPPPRGDAAIKLASAVGGISRRFASAGGVQLAFAAVVDPRPGSLTARLQGYDGAAEVLAVDYFDLFPLDTGDVVLCARPGAEGAWVVVGRVTGSEPEFNIDPMDINGSFVSAGEGITHDGEESESEIIHWRSPSTSFLAGVTEDFIWTFQRPFSLTPWVQVSLQSSAAGAHELRCWYSQPTDIDVILHVHNAGASPLTGRVVASAHGAV